MLLHRSLLRQTRSSLPVSTRISLVSTAATLDLPPLQSPPLRTVYTLHIFPEDAVYSDGIHPSVQSLVQSVTTMKTWNANGLHRRRKQFEQYVFSLLKRVVEQTANRLLFFSFFLLRSFHNLRVNRLTTPASRNMHSRKLHFLQTDLLLQTSPTASQEKLFELIKARVESRVQGREEQHFRDRQMSKTTAK